jgi:endonuclease-3
LVSARTTDIERAIRAGGLSRLKAPRIKAALRAIKKKAGRFSLDFLEHMPVSEARSLLESMNGVGPKTACCVLMFCYRKPALPVDTHVHRVAERLGLLPSKCTVGHSHELLQEICPDRLVYAFHVLLVEHGRTTCQARVPKCDRCSLAGSCPSRQC